MARGKCEVLWWQEGLPFPGSRAPGTWEPGLVTQGWGMLPRVRLVVEGPGCACGVPSLGPKLASPGSDKSHLLGASPLFFHPYRGIHLRMVEKGDIRDGGDWTVVSAGLPPRRPFTGTPAPCVRAPWRHRAAYLGMQVSCGG